MTGTLTLVLGGVALLGTVLATVRVRRPGELAFAYMMTGWLVGELAVFHFILQVMTVALLVWQGALDTSRGQLGLALLVLSMLGLVVAQARAARAKPALEAALVSALGDDYREQIRASRPDAITPPPPRQVWRPFHFDHGGVEVIRDLDYGEHGKRNQLDIYRPSGTAADELRPVVVYLHGGAWVIGNKEQQGKPMLLHLAKRGWIGVAVNYRLAPRDRWPAQIVDVKRAVAWVRQHIAEYGGDPSFVAISGSSAGGHLAALVALSADDPAFQPGFEEADTSVNACVPIYAPFDLTDRSGNRGRASLRRFLEWRVMSTRLADDPAGWRAASPLWRVDAGAPAMFVIQGELDELVWREEAREFVEALRPCTRAPLALAVVPGAQHAFEVFNSVRSRETVDAIARFLEAAHVMRASQTGDLRH